MDRKATIRFGAAMAVGCPVLALLVSCAAPQQVATTKQAIAPNTSGFELVSQTTGHYSQCVPYARDFSGIQIYGDAWTWWSQANGRYDRGHTPQRGAVLTLKKTKRLTAGHVAVVASIIDSRHILVDHANWGNNSSTRGKIHVRQPAIDVSPKNDWSQIRFLNTLGSFGAVYPAYGFIYADTTTHTAQNQAASGF
jgi:surface antigen